MQKEIWFKTLDKELVDNLRRELINFFKKINLKRSDHFFIAGLGSRSITSDSLGPKTIDYINANFFMSELGLKVYPKISLLEPGTLGKTGIPTKRILESIIDETKPNILIVIDSMLANNKKELNKVIKISDEGLTPGYLSNINESINKKTLGIPVLSILVPTSLKNGEYLLSTSNIDVFIDSISKVIGKTLNEVLYRLGK